MSSLNRQKISLLFLCTVLHFSVDGVCGALAAEYAVNESDYGNIVFYFALYNIIAFGSQFIAGLILDRHKNFVVPSLALVPVLLAGGFIYDAGILIRMILIATGNCIFHVSAGILILERYNGFKEPGIFVSSGALGLALGMEQFAGAITFEILCAVFTIAAVIHVMKSPAESENHHDESTHEHASYFIAGALMLLLCVVLRGFGGGSRIPGYVLLMPCVFVLGKSFGGVLCDLTGWRKTILSIFILGFAGLQVRGITGSVILTFAFNMTMPLTLRLLHMYFPKSPGLTFGLAAGCLLPGTFFGSYFSIPPEIMIVIQFLGLFFAGFIFIRYRRDEKFSFTKQY